ncbi:MAG: SDR family NAD(P)-dependent oxidoreductase [Rhizobiaceae bacterium]
MNDADKLLAGQVALISGASRGIGAATAHELARAGARIIGTYNSDREAAESVMAALPGEGHSVRPLKIEDSGAIAALAGDVERCDILVNNAGFTRAIPHADLDALDDAFIDAMFQANWRGHFAMVRALRPLLSASGKGLVVNVSSIAGMNGAGSNIVYCAVKAAMDSMTKSLARALAPDIRVMGVAPGVVETDFVPGRDAAAKEKLAAAIPLKRVAQAQDVARAILACATHLDYSTGSTLIVDGGRAL